MGELSEGEGGGDKMAKTLKILSSYAIMIGFFMTVNGCATIRTALKEKPPAERRGQIVELTVDSINNNETMINKNLIILPANKDVILEDLQFQEYASYLKREMVSKGYNIVENMENADIVVFLGYGISEPKENIVSYSLPVYGKTGVSSATTYKMKYTNFNITNYTPEYGIVGEKNHIRRYSTYTRYIYIVAYDNKLSKSAENIRQLWKTEIISNGTSDDLRWVYPIMLAAAKQYISENTEHKISLKIRENDEAVKEIKRTLESILRK